MKSPEELLIGFCTTPSELLPDSLVVNEYERGIRAHFLKSTMQAFCHLFLKLQFTLEGGNKQQQYYYMYFS
jgi:hypothetical protein